MGAAVRLDTATALDQRFAAAIDTLKPAAPYALAVSGGPDSLCLMHLAARLCEGRHWPRPVVLTFDHRLRPQSGSEAAEVAAWAQALGLSHHTLAADGTPPATGVQAWARRARYQAMGAFCAAQGIESLLTGHHRDDLFETIAMRAARKADFANDGMAMMALLPGVPFAEVRLVRPLLFEPKAALIAHVQALGQRFFSDPANLDRRFERACLRLNAPGTAPTLADVFAARMARTKLEKAVEELFHTHVRTNGAGFFLVPRAILRRDDPASLRLLAGLIALASGADYLPPRDAVRALVEWSAATPALSLLRADVRAAPRHLVGPDHLMIGVESPRNPGVAVPVPLGPFIWDGRFDIDAASAPEGALIQSLGLHFTAQLRRENRELRAIPARALAQTPALVLDGRVIAAPFAQIEGALVAKFRNSLWLPYAAFPQGTAA